MVRIIWGILAVFSLFVCVSLVSAVETPIHLDVDAFSDVSIIILEPGEGYYSLQSFNLNTGPSRSVDVVYEGTESDEIDIRVIVKRLGEIVYNEEYEGYAIGFPIEIDLLEGEAPVEETETVEEETIAKEKSEGEEKVESGVSESEKESDSITGSAIVGETGGLPGIVYYVVGAIFLAGIVGLVLFRRSKRINVPSGNVPKQEKASVSVPQKAMSSAEELADAERKIQEAQEEIRKLKDKERAQSQIDEAQKRFEQAKTDLDKLKGGN